MSTPHPSAAPWWRHPRTIAVAVLLTVAALVVVGGTLARFPDFSPARPDPAALTGAVTVEEGPTWAARLAGVGIGDTVTDTATVSSTHPGPVRTLRLRADIADTPARGHHARADRLSEAVVVDVFAGGDQLLDAAPLLRFRGGVPLRLPHDLTADTPAALTLRYHVAGAPESEPGARGHGRRDSVANPDNRYQGATVTIRYTITATSDH